MFNSDMWLWPQWIMVIFIILTIIVHSVKHGQDRGEYNIIESLFSLFIYMTLLICGNFFN